MRATTTPRTAGSAKSSSQVVNCGSVLTENKLSVIERLRCGELHFVRHCTSFAGIGYRLTQRLDDARLPEKPALIEGGLLGVALAKLTPEAAVIGGVGGDPASHGVEPDETEIWMDLADRVGHTLVLGTTRVGKTRLAQLLIAQDIRRGKVVIVFDPKGDVDLLRCVFDEAERARRGGEFFMFHLGHPEISARYNTVGSFSRITEVAPRIAGQLPSEAR